jgi:methionine synthase II (cobalamin-independent)
MTSPVLPTSVIGSHALPSWLWLAREAMVAGRYGARDIAETLEDATRIAIADQTEAGVDLISDGEMRRVNFILGFYEHIEDLETLPPARRMGAPHWDTQTPFRAVERLSAPHGLGLVDDFRLARSLTDKPLKATCPGPVTLSVPIRRGEVYATREAMLADLVGIVNNELKGLVAAGADFIQIDEPNYVMRSDHPQAWLELFNAVVEGVQAKIALHICFGNLNNKPFAAPRSYAHLFPHILQARAAPLALEFANREMAEIEEMGQDPAASSVTTLLVGGEPGASVPATKHRLEALWGAQTFEFYGSTEVAPTPGGYMCQVGSTTAPYGLHFMEDLHIVELIDPETLEPVPEGQRGLSVAINLFSEAAPLIRFVIGDFGQFVTTPCGCGRTHLCAPGGFKGRADDLLNIRGVTVFPLAIEEVVRSLETLADEFTIIVTNDTGLDELTTVQVEPRQTLSGQEQSRLQDDLGQRLRAVIEVRPRVELVAPGTIPRPEFKASRVRDQRREL